MCAMTQQWNKCEKHVCEWQFHKAHSGNSSMAPRERKFYFFTRKIFIATGFVVVVVIEKGPRERERCQHVREAKSDMNAHDTWTRGAFWTLSGIFTLNLKFFSAIFHLSRQLSSRLDLQTKIFWWWRCCCWLMTWKNFLMVWQMFLKRLKK